MRECKSTWGSRDDQSDTVVEVKVESIGVSRDP